MHVNEGKDGTVKYLKEKGVEHTFTTHNAGICEGLNKALQRLNVIIFYIVMMIFIFVQDGMKL